MNCKKLLLFLLCCYAGIVCSHAVDFEYVGTANVQVTTLQGIGSSSFYLLKGNLGVKDATVGNAGGFYSGISAKGATATQECVCRLVTVTDSTFYVYFPGSESYWKTPSAKYYASVTKEVSQAAVVLMKASTRINGCFTMSTTDANGKLYYFQDWGNLLGALPPSENGDSLETDGESDWTIYRADVKQEALFPIMITKADGIVTPTSTSNLFKSRDFYSAQPISSLRFTVLHTLPSDSYNSGSHQGFLYWCISEMSIYDASGNKISLSADNFSSNATEESEGSLANLCDGEITNYFHTCWNSHTGAIGGEHYVEVSLPEPVYGFSFDMTARSNNKHFPSEIAITAGGTDYDAYSAYGFKSGDEVTAGSETGGKLYVMKSAYADTGIDEYPGYGDKRRARISPKVDCIFSLVDAGAGTFYIKYFLKGQYVAAPTAAGNLSLVAGTATAGAFTFGADGTISCGGYNLYIKNEALAAIADSAITWTVYAGSIDNAEALAQLKSSIDAAQAIANTNGEKYSANDDGEKAALDAELATANAMYSAGAALSTEILTEIDALEKKAAKFEALEILYLCDSIDNILMTENFANAAGAYPVSQSTILTNTSTNGRSYFDASAFSSPSEVEAYIAKIEAVIATFWNSQIKVTVLPVTYTTADGLPGTATDAGTQYRWNSPQYFFEEPVSTLRMTVTNNNTGSKGAGYYCFAISEFYVFDEKGDTLALTANDYSTNAQEPSEGPIANVCDGNTSTSNYFHTRWSAGGANTGDHYLQVTLPEPMYQLSFGYITRNLRTCPTEMTITAGNGLTVTDSIGTVVGDQVTASAQLSTNDYYVLYGNLNKLAATPTDGSGYYNTTAVGGYTADRYSLFKLEDAGNGAFRIHFIMSDKYIGLPMGWSNATSTYKSSEAGEFLFKESTNLTGAFVIYEDGSFSSSYPNCHYLLQDWGSDNGMGVYPVANLDSADADGETDWTIYKASFTASEDSVLMLGVINRAIATMPLQGTNPGYYPNIADFTAAFKSAVELRYNGTAASDYVAATTALRNVLNNLGDYIKPQAGHCYTLVSAYTEYLKQQNVEKAMLATGSTTLGWGDLYAAGCDTAQYYWTLEDATDTTGCVYLKNLYTGTYISYSTSTSAIVGLSETPAHYVLQLVGKAEFKLKNVDGIKNGLSASYGFLHTQGHSNGAGTGGNIVNWSASIDNPTCWYLREVDPSLVNLSTVSPVKVATITYYTLNGQTVAAPSKGLYIIKKVYSDGNIKVEKILIQ